MKMINVVFCFALALLTSEHGAFASNTGQVPESFQLQTLDGKTIRGNAKSRYYRAVQIWASWCASCGQTMIDMRSFIAKEKLTLKFIAVSVDEDLKSAQSYFLNRGESSYAKDLAAVRSSAFFDPGTKFSENLGIEAVPTIYIISPQGLITRTIVGHPTEQDFQYLREIQKSEG